MANSEKKENSIEKFGYKQELKRTLTFWDLFIYGLALMVPIAPFGIYGYVAQASNGMVALTYLVGMLAMFFTAISYMRMSEEFPISGSVYSYAQRGINDFFGFIAGWIILLDYIFVPTLIYLVSIAPLSSIFPAVPTIVWLVIFIGSNTLLNYYGVKLSSYVNKIILTLILIVLVIYLIVGLIAITKGFNGAEFSFKPLYDPNKFSFSILMGAVSIAVLSFLGFDAISTLSEESKGAKKDVGKSMLWALFAIGFIFIGQTWITALIWPDYTSFRNLDTAFYDIAEAAGGPWLKLLAALSMSIAFGFANAMVFQAAISRLLYSMARDKKLPAILARIHPKHQTPYMSILVVAILSLLIATLFVEHLGELTLLVNFGALTGFILLHLSVINHFFVKQKSGDYLNHLIMPAIGLLIIIYVWFSLSGFALIFGVCWILIGSVCYYFFLSKPKKGTTNITG